MYGDIFHITMDKSAGTKMTLEEIKDKYKKMFQDMKDSFEVF